MPLNKRMQTFSQERLLPTRGGAGCQVRKARNSVVPFNIHFTQWCIGKKCRLHEVEGAVLGLDLFYLHACVCVTRIKLRLSDSAAGSFSHCAP